MLLQFGRLAYSPLTHATAKSLEAHTTILCSQLTAHSISSRYTVNYEGKRQLARPRLCGTIIMSEARICLQTYVLFLPTAQGLKHTCRYLHIYK